MSRKDLVRILIIGAGVGLLIQPILGNNLPANDLHYLTLPARFGIFFLFLIVAPLALWIAKLLSNLSTRAAGIYQFAQFAAVGTLNSFLDVGVFNLETFFYGSALISNGLFAVFKAISFLVGTTNSFIWNKTWTFGATSSGDKAKTNAKQVTGFYTIAIIGWVFNITAATLTKAYGPSHSTAWVNIVAPLAGVAVSFIWNFLGYKYWVFKERA